MEDWNYLCIALIRQANITNEDIDIIINEIKGVENTTFEYFGDTNKTF